jgi:hypothetical protein
MDIIAQYSNVLFGMLLITIVLAMLVMVIYVACQGNNPAPDEHTSSGATQNRNVNGGIRRPHKDINSY